MAGLKGGRAHVFRQRQDSILNAPVSPSVKTETLKLLYMMAIFSHLIFYRNYLIILTLLLNVRN